MSRGRRRILLLFFTLAILCSATALSQLSAHWGVHQAEGILCRPMNLITREDILADGACHTLPELQNGDILLTDSTHSFGWRHGHAGLVVDREKGLVLEAEVLGRPSCVVSVEHWKHYATLMVFRLRDADAETRQKVAAFALSELDGIPYRISSGLLGAPAENSLTAQCAYLVWYAYAHFGYDLDGDGGRLVTVADIAASPLLERVDSTEKTG